MHYTNVAGRITVCKAWNAALVTAPNCVQGGHVALQESLADQTQQPNITMCAIKLNISLCTVARGQALRVVTHCSRSKDVF